jgi:hypothetical protein
MIIKQCLMVILTVDAAMAQHTGMIVGSPVFSSGALATTGDSDYIALPEGSFPVSAPSWAIKARLKTSVSSSVQVAVSFGAPVNDHSIWIGASAGKFAAAVEGAGGFAGGNQLISSTSIADGAWHDCTITMTGGTTIRLYVDSVLSGTFTGVIVSPQVDSSAGMIGRFTYGTSWGWPGGVDEVSVWSTATPPTGPYLGVEPGLWALYHLDSDGSESGTTSFTMDNGSLIFSPYNWAISAASARTINSGAYLRTIVSGTSVRIATNTTPNVAPFSQFKVQIDGHGWAQFNLSSGSPAILIASGMDATRKHLIEIIIKATSGDLLRWSSSQTMITFTGIILDAGQSLTAPLRKTKSAIIFGDSITEGVRTENCTAPVAIDRNDVFGDYSYSLIGALDAEIGIVGFGGQAVTQGGLGGVPSLQDSYGSVFSGVPRYFTGPPLDLAIYNMGTNESRDITSGLISVVNGILATAPSSTHLLLVPFNQVHASEVAAAVAAIGPRAILGITYGWFIGTNSCDGLHPDSVAHLGFIAPKILKLARSIGF